MLENYFCTNVYKLLPSFCQILSMYIKCKYLVFSLHSGANLIVFQFFDKKRHTINPHLSKRGGYHPLTVCRQLHQNRKKVTPGI